MRKVLYILGELEDSDLQWLVDAGDSRTFARDTTIITEGTSLDSLFIVIEGELLVTKTGSEIARLGTGEVVGDMSLLDSRPPSATVTTVRDSTLYVVSQAALRRKLSRDMSFAARFYRALCIFLANRLTKTASLVGAQAGGGGGSDPSEDDTITADSLESVALAGARFEWFMQRLGSQ